MDSSLPFVGRATRFYTYLRNLPHSRRSCAFQPERLYSRFPPLALPKYGTLACPISFFLLPFYTIVYICSQFRSSTRQFCDPTLFPLTIYPATSRLLYWRFLVSNVFNLELVKHEVRPHVRVSKARASAPPLPLSFFMPSRQKGTPTRCILEHEVPSTQCKTSLPSRPYSCGCAEFQPQRLFPLCPLRLSHNISQLCCCLGINRPLYCLTSIYLPCS